MTPILDRRAPTDWDHVSKYPFQSGQAYDDPVPVIAGTNWYSFMDSPVWDESENAWWIGRDLQPDMWGRPRGGHCYVLKPDGLRDLMSWYAYYDQGVEGKCVGFGTARALSLVDRRKFDPHIIYHRAQEIDEWPGTDYSGTSVRAAVDVVRSEGAAIVRAGKTGPLKLEHGISANRWGQSIEDLNEVLKSPRLEKRGVKAILNSWGPLRDNGYSGYPHIVYVPDEVVDRLTREDGEMTMFVPA